MIYRYCTQLDSKCYHQKSFGVRIDLITCLYLVFDAESEKKNEAENFTDSEKDVFFKKKRYP